MYPYQDDFMQQFTALITAEMKKRGYGNGPVILAQAILESGWGTSNLAKKHNYFGITAVKSYTGETYKGFMVYPSREVCVSAYFDLMDKPRYAGLKGISVPDAYIDELIRSGYCTDESYKQNLMNIIQGYRLVDKFPLVMQGTLEADVPAKADGDSSENTQESTGQKCSSMELIREIIQGTYGNGKEREKTLTEMGYDAKHVQDLVNVYMHQGPRIPAIIDGKYGNGNERRKLLLSEGLTEDDVTLLQELVNMSVPSFRN